MEISLFLAKLLGVYMLIVAVIWLFRRNQFETSIKDIFNSPGVLALAGSLSLLAGLSIVIGHNIWDYHWRVVITILGYIAVAKGVLRLAFPEQAQRWVNVVLSRGYWIGILIVGLLGLFLTYHGFVR